ncbi:MAG: hypothetical protein ACFCVE_11680 [Phycisphaerae bacterium]
MQVHSMLIAAAGVALLGSNALAATVLFGDNFANGASARSESGTTVTLAQAPEPVASGTTSLKLNYTGNFTQAGIEGGVGLIDTNEVLRFDAYRDAGSMTLTLRLGGGFTALQLGNGAPGREFVTVNGAPVPTNGNILPADQWVDVVVDLRSITGQSVSAFTFFNGGGAGVDTLYLDNVRIEVIPEPASLGLAGLATIGLLPRRSRR